MVKNVLNWLEDSAKKFPQKIVYKSQDMKLSFEDVLDGSKRIGTGILKLDMQKTPVAVLLEKEVTTILAYLGVVYSGRAYAPIDATLPKQRLININNTLKPSVVITDEAHKELAAELNPDNGQVKIVLLKDLLKTKICEDMLNAVRRHFVETNPLYIIFTSGSSGIPKGVVTSHQSLMNYIEAYVKVMGITEDDRLGNQSPLDYIAAIRDIYVPLFKGASSYLVPKQFFMQPERLAGVMIEEGITSLGWSSSALTVLASLGFLENSKVKTLSKICFSGSVINGTVLRKWQESYPDVLFVNQYGPTEATASCTYYVVDHVVENDEVIPIGVPYNNYKIYLIKEDGTEAKVGECGQICVGGPVLALGYLGNLKKTKEDFIQNPLNESFEERIYKTGDIGRIREDGNLEFHGRMDRQIKHMGHRVELDEIESAAMTIDGMSECLALYSHETETIYLFYSGDVESKKIAVSLRKLIPGFMVPRKIRQLDELPKLPNSKIDMVTIKSMM